MFYLYQAIHRGDLLKQRQTLTPAHSHHLRPFDAHTLTIQSAEHIIVGATYSRETAGTYTIFVILQFVGNDILYAVSGSPRSNHLLERIAAHPINLGD